MKAVYIGAGLDLDPLDLPINEFIYIDSQPFSEHGTHAYTESYEAITCTKKTRFLNLFSRPRFLENLKANLTQKGYNIINRTGDFIVFTNNTKKIKYYYSCSFPEFVEDNLLKQGLFMPLSHIPIVATEEIYKRKPDYILILAWNFAEPIMEIHKRYLENGGHFILPLPEPKIV